MKTNNQTICKVTEVTVWFTRSKLHESWCS